MWISWFWWFTKIIQDVTAGEIRCGVYEISVLFFSNYVRMYNYLKIKIFVEEGL